jgi:hypothetical protein
MASPARKVKERADDSADAVTRLSEVTDKMHGLLLVDQAGIYLASNSMNSMKESATGWKSQLPVPCQAVRTGPLPIGQESDGKPVWQQAVWRLR